MNTRLKKSLDDWECVNRFLESARIDIARGEYMKATAMGLVATSEFMEQQGMTAEGWAGYEKDNTK
jgi:hypothetical protein